ncbi:MAG: bifunctional hydroxymethylpyrimidine kinase/phosphomethylpyrimidine kinase [Thermoplasmata archaeon]|nr:bifunctional hydroxymethylpyrimidine kinase/phosphomethylpyrimidine kinase [Thermoplasmata archaeon]
MESVKKVLCISSLDTSGFSGIGADINAISSLGVQPLPVIVNHAIETQEAVVDVVPVAREIVEKAVKVGLSEKLDAIKLGMLGKNMDLVAGLLPGGVPVIADPVFVSTSGHLFASKQEIEVFANKIAPKATLITPNVAEAELLLGVKIRTDDDARIACLEIHKKIGCGVLVKGGHLSGTDYLAWRGEVEVFKGDRKEKALRGTGCVLASMIAAHVAKGYDVHEAVEKSKASMNRLIESAEPAGRKYWLNVAGILRKDAERWETWNSLSEAIPEFLAVLKNEHIPEVGINIGFALPEATKKEEVCAIDGRIVKTMEGPRVRLRVKFGAGDHVPRIILTVMRFSREMRCAMNLRYAPETVAKAKHLGFVVGSFSRTAGEPGQGTMEWGVEIAVKTAGRVPDLIYDTGDVGKEPMIRLIAENPEKLLEKLRKLVG